MLRLQQCITMGSCILWDNQHDGVIITNQHDGLINIMGSSRLCDNQHDGDGAVLIPTPIRPEPHHNLIKGMEVMHMRDLIPRGHSAIFVFLHYVDDDSPLKGNA